MEDRRSIGNNGSVSNDSQGGRLPGIELHIEELVLHGFPAGDHHRIAAAVQRELSRMLAGGDIPSTLMQEGELTQLDSGEFTIAAGAGSEAIGMQIAEAVYRGLAGYHKP